MKIGLICEDAETGKVISLDIYDWDSQPSFSRGTTCATFVNGHRLLVKPGIGAGMPWELLTRHGGIPGRM